MQPEIIGIIDAIIHRFIVMSRSKKKKEMSFYALLANEWSAMAPA